MAFNGSGVFTLVAGNPVVTGTTISSTWANNTLSDIATGLSTTITKDGQSTPTANIRMGGFKLTGLAAGTANGDAMRFEQTATQAGTQSQTYTAFTTAGTTTAYTLTPTPAIGSLVAGQRFRVKFNATNTTQAPTLAVSGLAATALKMYDAAGVKQNPGIGSLAVDMLTDVEYDGTDYVVLDQLPRIPSQGNLLINGNFNINQRVYVSGTATGGANQYTLDRWRVVTSGQSLTFAASGNGNQVTAPAGGIEQVVEGASIGSAAAVINWTGTATCTVDGVAKAKGDPVTLTPGTNCTVKFTGGTVSQAQLEYGAAPTAFQFRPITQELVLCQRYYEVIEIGIVANSAGTISIAGTGSFLVTKRIAPTPSRLGSGLSGLTAPTTLTTTVNSYYFDKAAISAGGSYAFIAEI